ncbi:hypothetical protein [Saccharibacillus sp. O23]|uniref:hypothetical protein n=1 Tax=Saccharibacillus sp. O23 TaxID=2009338 RepID=UPI00117AB5B4|nr:hypothetical protein [Saccharibacillus sp. O23]
MTLLVGSSSVSAEGTNVSDETARRAVEADLAAMNPEHEYYGRWQSAEATYVQELYDLEDRVIGYYFVLKSGGQPVGYYVTSARTDLPPILEYGADPSKPEFEAAAEGERIYYFGGRGAITGQDGAQATAEIRERVEAQNEAAAEAKKVPAANLRQSEEEPAAPPENAEDVIASLTLAPHPDAAAEWERVANPPRGAVAAALPDTYKLDVPFIYQRTAGIDGPGSACGPTTLAMILQYLGKQGLDVEDARYYNNSVVGLVNGNRNIMSTGAFGTTAGNMVFGLQNTLRPRPGWTFAQIDAASSGAIEKYKSRIASGRPPALMWDKLVLFPWTDAELKWHWQAGSAYTYSGGNFMFGVKDPDRDSTTRYYNWTSNQSGFLFVSYAK